MNNFEEGKSSCFIPPPVTPESFVARVNEAYAKGEVELKEGYAPFCKHIFIPNFTAARAGAMPITEENISRLRSGYLCRQEGELAVLFRWFPMKGKSSGEEDGVEGVEPPVAEWLDVILYSREQVRAECHAMGRKNDGATEPWAIISIKPQSLGHELPMQPITMLRNALGKAEGGSGIPLDRAKYEESVSYWRDHAVVM